MQRLGLLLLTLLLCACAPQTRVVIVPTLAQLPTITPSSTDRPTETATITPSPTVTPSVTFTPVTITATLTVIRDDAMNTAQAQLTALNATISSYQTATPTTPPTATLTPQPAIVNLDPQYFAVRGDGQLLTCPSRACGQIASLPTDTVLLVDALIYGEEVDFGNALWYRVQWQPNVTGYIFSAGVVPVAPNANPAQQFPTLPPPAISTPLPVQPLISGSVNPSLCPMESPRCTTLQTCEQAMACLAAGNRGLDRDGDGIPCEDLCGG